MGVSVREVWLCPNGGRVARAWIEGSPGGDAPARAAVVVDAQRRPLLAEHEVWLRRSGVQVYVPDEPSSGPDLELTVFDDPVDGGQAAKVSVPAAVAELAVEHDP
jgi:hypothetical protein